MNPQLLDAYLKLLNLSLDPIRRRYLTKKLLLAPEAEWEPILTAAQEEAMRNNLSAQSEYSKRLREQRAYEARNPERRK